MPCGIRHEKTSLGQPSRPVNEEDKHSTITTMAITNDEFCLTVMRELAEVGGANSNALANRQPTGLLDALKSAENTQGTEVDRLYDQGDGKAHKVILKYLKPDSTSEVTDTVTNICDTEGEETTYNYDEVTLDYASQSATKKLTVQQMRTLCETGNEFRAKIIQGMMNSVLKHINRTIIAPFDNGAGGLIGGNGATGTSYNLLYRNGLVQVDPEGWLTMLQNLMDTGMTGTPILVGGGNLKKFADLQGIACCNNYGQDPAALGDVQLYYDNDIQTVLGNASSGGTDFFAFMPGAAQFVDKPLNQGQFREIHEHYIYDTITDPVSGLTFDFNAYYDTCDRIWKWNMSLHYGLWQLPLDMFKSGDDRFKVNFNWSFKADETSAG